MPILELTEEEKATLKKDLLNFVHRVSADTGNRWDCELQILPAIAQILLMTS